MSHRIKVRKVGYGRNDLCPCGSGLKYKKCCLAKIIRHANNAVPEETQERQAVRAVSRLTPFMALAEQQQAALELDRFMKRISRFPEIQVKGYQ